MRDLFLLRMRKGRNTLLTFVVGVFIFAGIMVWSYDAFAEEAGFLSLMFSQFKDLMQAFVGVGFSIDELVASYLAMGWRHPLVVFLFLGFAISRAGELAREMETGTGDLLFSLPYYRYQILLTEYLATIAGLFIINFFLAASVYGWSLIFSLEDLPSLMGFFWVFVLSFLLYSMFAALAFLVASRSRTAGQATGYTIGIVAVLYLADFLSSIQPQLEFMQPYTLFHQYQVTEALIRGAGLWGEFLIYFLLTMICILGASYSIQKRDL